MKWWVAMCVCIFVCTCICICDAFFCDQCYWNSIRRKQVFFKLQILLFSANYVNLYGFALHVLVCKFSICLHPNWSPSLLPTPTALCLTSYDLFAQSWYLWFCTTCICDWFEKYKTDILYHRQTHACTLMITYITFIISLTYISEYS